MKYKIGIDIGGTNIVIGMIDESGKLQDHEIIPTDLSISPFDMISKINDKLKTMIKRSKINENDIKGIGIGAPGPLDSKKGMIICPPNLQTWKDIPIKKWIEDEFPYPVQLENDANAATLAERYFGAGKNIDNFIYMTISTGIGAGIFSEGKLLHGQKGNAGDIGHVVVDPSFGKCVCGQYGCLENIASGTAISREGSKIFGESLTTKEVFDLYKEGHSKIVPYIDRVLEILGIACVNLINTFDTERIVIGGGVSKVGALLFDTLQNYVNTYALTPHGRYTEVVPAQLELHSGVIGAALCVDVVE
ncbi:MAG TPA: ROK family protein [Bacillota bacterium]|nr:ROK family protein [Bacillota bacterium]